MDVRSLECAAGGFHKKVIHADGANVQVELLNTELFDEFLLKRVAG